MLRRAVATASRAPAALPAAPGISSACHSRGLSSCSSTTPSPPSLFISQAVARHLRAQRIHSSSSDSSSAAMTASSAAKRGAFILFEGIDRCGKSTQAEKLVDNLKAQGVRDGPRPGLDLSLAFVPPPPFPHRLHDARSALLKNH